jgi:hypothetical protein
MATSTREYFEGRVGALNMNRVSSRRIAAIVKQALDIRDRSADEIAKAGDHPHLNDLGKRAEKQKAALDWFVHNERNRRALKQIREEGTKALTSLALPTLEKGDIVGEMREAEARAIVRAMSQQHRDNLRNLSPAFLAAVVRAPAELSGLSPSVHKLLHDQLIETAYPDKIAEIRAEDEALELADEAVREAQKALDKAVDLAGDDRAQFMAVVSQAAATSITEENQAPDPNDLDALIAANRKRAA